MRVLAVDGGQSGIRMRRAALGEESPGAVVEVEGVSRLEGDPVLAVAAAVAEGWRRGDFAPVDRVVLGLTTASPRAGSVDRLCALVAASTGAAEVWLADDSVTSHAGALSGGHGVSLVAGTGVACLAVPKRGEARTIDGHGYLIGDAGGGFWVGSRGVAAVLDARDGRGPTTLLGEYADGRFGPEPGLSIRLHENPRAVNEIAHFAIDVCAAAERGDRVAADIVEEAAHQLLRTARAGAAWVGGAAVPLGIGGRLVAPGTPIRRGLDRLLSDDALAPRSIDPRSADASALEGAVLLGLHGAGAHYPHLIFVWKEGVTP